MTRHPHAAGTPTTVQQEGINRRLSAQTCQSETDRYLYVLTNLKKRNYSAVGLFPQWLLKSLHGVCVCVYVYSLQRGDPAAKAI